MTIRLVGGATGYGPQTPVARSMSDMATLQPSTSQVTILEKITQNPLNETAMKPLVIISGPIGAGKTTVARELVASSPPPVAYIEGDKFWFFIAKGAGRRREKDFKMIMTAITAAALPYALYGYEVILDFSIPPWFLETAQRVVKAKDLSLDYVVLRPSETVCATRAASRAEGTIADYTAYRELYSSFDGA